MERSKLQDMRDLREDDASASALVVIGVVIVAAGITASLAIAEAVMQTLHQSPAAPSSLPFVSCRSCGVVEEVRVIERSGPSPGVSTFTGGATEGTAILLGALTGARVQAGWPRIYEVAVRMEDGSVRALREPLPPEWKPGDRVRLIRGRIERLS